MMVVVEAQSPLTVGLGVNKLSRLCIYVQFEAYIFILRIHTSKMYFNIDELHEN